MRVFWQIILASWIVVIGIQRAAAIPPPDFIFAVGSQLGLIFSIAVIFLSSILGATATLARSFFSRIKHKKLFWSVVAIVVIAVSLGAGMYADNLWQAQRYTEWIQESAKNAGSEGINQQELMALDPTIASNISSTASSSSLAESDSTVSSIAQDDPNTLFLKQYYRNIGSGRLQEAYEVSKKSVPFETFKQWYANVTDVTVDSVEAIRENVYSVVATVLEGKEQTRYSVLMTLKQSDDGKTVIAQSTVKVVPSDDAPPTKSPSFEGVTTDQGVSEERLQTLVESVNDKEFANILATGQPFVLDAREDEEFETGRFPGSLHIRFADLLAGEWVSLPNDREVYVFCWSGIRGKEVTDFLRGKNVLARYIEGGADRWVKDGGTWEGGIKFSSTYTDERYQIVYSTDQVKTYQKDGVVLVDSRPQSKYEKSHIPGSINIPIIYTPTIRMDEVLSQVPPASTVITVCDDFVSCFDAKVTGVKLEKRGHTFLGRYNKPWEYRSTQ